MPPPDSVSLSRTNSHISLTTTSTENLLSSKDAVQQESKPRPRATYDTGVWGKVRRSVQRRHDIMKAGFNRANNKLAKQEHAQRYAQFHLASAIVKLGQGKSPTSEYKAFVAAADKTGCPDLQDAIEQAIRAMNSEIKGSNDHFEKSINLLEKLSPNKLKETLKDLPTDACELSPLQSDFDTMSGFASLIRQAAFLQYAEDFPTLNGQLAHLKNQQLDDAVQVLTEFKTVENRPDQVGSETCLQQFEQTLLEKHDTQIQRWKEFSPALSNFVKSFASDDAGERDEAFWTLGGTFDEKMTRKTAKKLIQSGVTALTDTFAADALKKIQAGLDKNIAELKKTRYDLKCQPRPHPKPQNWQLKLAELAYKTELLAMVKAALIGGLDRETQA